MVASALGAGVPADPVFLRYLALPSPPTEPPTIIIINNNNNNQPNPIQTYSGNNPIMEVHGINYDGAMQLGTLPLRKILQNKLHIEASHWDASKLTHFNEVF